MTLKNAFIELINSVEYKDIAKLKTSQGSMHRTWSSRFKKDKLKTGAIVDILQANGYEIIATKAVKKKDVKKK